MTMVGRVSQHPSRRARCALLRMRFAAETHGPHPEEGRRPVSKDAEAGHHPPDHRGPVSWMPGSSPGMTTELIMRKPSSRARRVRRSSFRLDCFVAARLAMTADFCRGGFQTRPFPSTRHCRCLVVLPASFETRATRGNESKTRTLTHFCNSFVILGNLL